LTRSKTFCSYEVRRGSAEVVDVCTAGEEADEGAEVVVGAAEVGVGAVVGSVVGEDVVAVVVVSVVGSSAVPLHFVPLKVKALGVGAVVREMPMSPKDAVPLVGMEPLCHQFLAVARPSAAFTEAFQDVQTFWSSAVSQSSVQPETGSPRLVTDTVATNPPDHCLTTWYSAEHPAAVPAPMAVVSRTLPTAVTATAAAANRVRRCRRGRRVLDRCEFSETVFTKVLQGGRRRGSARRK
jgi:hypothetical protein